MPTRPTRHSIRFAVALAALTGPLAVAGPSRAADPGDTGLAFLKIGVGARAAAMGEAYVAVAQDPTSLYWNPAGISTQVGDAFHATHNEWISDVRYEWVAAVHGMQGHALGAHVGFLHMGELDGRDELGNFTGHFRAYDLVAGLSYGRRLARSLEVGITGKFLFEKIDGPRAFGGAADLGLRYRTPVRGLTMAATLTNVGTPMKFEDESFILPAQGRIGAAYRTLAVLEGLLVAADVRMPNDSDVKTHYGVELWAHEMVALRAGVKTGYDEEAGSFGAGFRYLDYQVDYAFLPFSNDSELGDTHRVSLNWTPGRVANAQK